MNSSVKKRCWTVYLLAALMLLLSIGGLYGGIMLMIDPFGKLLQLDIRFIQQTFFKNYLLPGTILFFFNGIFPLFVSICLLKNKLPRWPERFNMYKNYHWPWTFSLYVGIVLLTWIIVQLIIIGFIGLLQVWCGIAGLVILFFTIIPSTKKYFKK